MAILSSEKMVTEHAPQLNHEYENRKIAGSGLDQSRDLSDSAMIPMCKNVAGNAADMENEAENSGFWAGLRRCLAKCCMCYQDEDQPEPEEEPEVRT